MAPLAVYRLDEGVVRRAQDAWLARWDQTANRQITKGLLQVASGDVPILTD